MDTSVLSLPLSRMDHWEPVASVARAARAARLARAVSVASVASVARAARLARAVRVARAAGVVRAARAASLVKGSSYVQGDVNMVIFSGVYLGAKYLQTIETIEQHYLRIFTGPKRGF